MSTGDHQNGRREMPPDDLRDEARAWLVRLASGETTDSELAEFESWRSRSPQHEAAYSYEQAAWRQAESFRQQLGPSSWAAEGHDEPSHHIPPPPSSSQTAPILRNASFGALAMVAMLTIWIFGNDAWISLIADHRSASGQQAQVTLPDGSIALLNTNSAIDVEYGDRERRVSLLQGEAHFDVKSNDQAPFLVFSHGHTALAVGTAFAVRQDGGRIIVTVTEGTVEVRQAAEYASSTEPVTAIEDQQVISGRDGKLTSARDVDPERALAWRSGKIVFEDVPFEQAIAELDRYQPGRIVIAAAGPKGPVSGIFSSAGLDAAIGTLAALKGMRVQTVTPYLTVIY